MNSSRIRSTSRPKTQRRSVRASAHPHFPEIWRTAPGTIAAKVVSQLLSASPPR